MEDIKQSLFAGDMTLYVEKPRLHPKMVKTNKQIQ